MKNWWEINLLLEKKAEGEDAETERGIEENIIPDSVIFLSGTDEFLK